MEQASEEKKPRILVKDSQDLMKDLKAALKREAQAKKDIKEIGNLLHSQYGVETIHITDYDLVHCGPKKKPNTSGRVSSDK